MRIALLTYSTRPRGSVVHALALAEALAALGEDVTVHAVDRRGEGFFRTVDSRVRVALAECADSDDLEHRVLSSIGAFQGSVDIGDYDVLHAQDCIAANAVRGCVRTVHHLDSFSTPVLVECHRRGIVNPAAHVCVSAAVAAELAEDWGKRARVIPNGVDFARFADAATPAGAQARERWRRQLGAGQVILTVGGIEPRKGSLDLLEAFAHLRATHPQARLVIAGGETLFDYREYREAFDARRSELGVPVEVLGPVADGDLPALVACADAFALTSVREGFGLAAMEALAAAVPVVLRDGPVLGEVFRGAAAFAASPTGIGDALAAALDAPSDEHRANGVALAARHTWDRAARSHLDLYHSFVERPGRIPANA